MFFAAQMSIQKGRKNCFSERVILFRNFIGSPAQMKCNKSVCECVEWTLNGKKSSQFRSSSIVISIVLLVFSFSHFFQFFSLFQHVYVLQLKWSFVKTILKCDIRSYKKRNKKTYNIAKLAFYWPKTIYSLLFFFSTFFLYLENEKIPVQKSTRSKEIEILSHSL